MSSTEGTPASPPNSAAENGKGVKRSPEQHDQQEDHHQQQQRGGDAVPPPSKTAKLNPPSDGHGAEKQDAEAPGGGVVESPPTDSERVEMEALSSMGLEVGTRLEVLWVLEDEDKSVEKWWGCSVVGAKTGERDEAEGRPVFTLHYDAYQAFEEANHDVCFVDKYRLLHLEDGAEMTWKKEGQEVDREAVMASLADEAVDLHEVVQAQEEEDSEGGESIETQGMRELAQLPHHQQMAMAAGYRRMADVVKEHLRAKMQSQQEDGREAVVSAEDIENMFRDVRAGAGSGGVV